MIVILAISIAIIAIGSAVDCYASWMTSLDWPDELNPVSRWILEKWGLTALLWLKGLATSVILTGLWIVSAWFLLPVVLIAGGVAAFMVGLVIFLWYWS